MTSARSGPDLVTLVACAAAAALLAWVEGAWWPFWGMLPGLAALHPRGARVALGWTVALGTVALCDLGLRAAGLDPLGARATRSAAVVDWVASGDERLVADDCPRHRFAPGDDVDKGPPRDARGRLVHTVPGPDPLRIWVTGDSVVHPDLAWLLAEALRTTGTPAVVTDTSVYSLDATDYACLAAETAGETYDLAVLGLTLNDVETPLSVTADLGAGPRPYAWASYVHEELALSPLPPLFLESTNPWVQARWDDLQARWPGLLQRDVADPDVLAPIVAQFASERHPAWGAVQHATTALQATGAHVVMPVWPLLLTRSPDPTRALVDVAVAQAATSGATVVDVRPTLATLGVEDLVELPRGLEAFRQGRGLHDLVHLSPTGLALALDAVLATWEAQGGPDLGEVRERLRAEAVALAPCGPRTCVATTPQIAEGVATMPAGCQPVDCGG